MSTYEQLDQDQKIKILAQKYKEISVKYKQTSQELEILKRSSSPLNLNSNDNNKMLESKAEESEMEKKLQYSIELVKKVSVLQYLTDQNKGDNCANVISEFIKKINFEINELLNSPQFLPEKSSFFQTNSPSNQNEIKELKQQKLELEQEIQNITKKGSKQTEEINDLKKKNAQLLENNRNLERQVEQHKNKENEYKLEIKKLSESSNNGITPRNNNPLPTPPQKKLSVINEMQEIKIETKQRSQTSLVTPSPSMLNQRISGSNDIISTTQNNPINKTLEAKVLFETREGITYRKRELTRMMEILQVKIEEARNISISQNKHKAVPLHLIVKVGVQTITTKQQLNKYPDPCQFSDDIKFALAREKSVTIDLIANVTKKKVTTQIEIGSAEVTLDKIPISNWFPILSKEKEVKGILKLSLFKHEVPNVLTVSLPRGPMALSLESNVTTTAERQRRIDPIEGELNEIQSEANKVEPDLKFIANSLVRNKNNGKIVDILWKNGRGQTYIHLMAKGNHVDALEILINRVKDSHERIDVVDNCGWTALHMCAVYGSLESYIALITAGASKERKDWNENSCLHLSATYNHPHIVQYLLSDDQISVDQKDEGSSTPLHKAAYSGSVDITQMLIDKKCFLDAEDRDGNNALMVSLIRKNDDVSILLIQNGIDLTCQNGVGDNPLWIAIYNKNMKLVEFLLNQSNLDVNKNCGKYQMNILQRCYLQLDDEEYCLKIEKMLMEKNVDINVQNSIGQSAIFYAAGMGRATSIQNLINNKVNVNVKDLKNNTPLHFSFELATTRAILLAGADVNAQNNEGNTPLHVACAFSSFDVINFLLANGASPTVTNNNGDYPMSLVLAEKQGIYFSFYEDDESYHNGGGLKIPKFIPRTEK